jgi:hypothetical protein
MVYKPFHAWLHSKNDLQTRKNDLHHVFCQLRGYGKKTTFHGGIVFHKNFGSDSKKFKSAFKSSVVLLVPEKNRILLLHD